MEPQGSNFNRGFTLIELSIVLVIIGLIVGGILVGRDLIQHAELRSVITQAENFKTAMNTFRLKYQCLPGDCPNATDYFGSDPGGCAPGTGDTGTCNGNNDGFIGVLYSWGDYREGFRFWQQLGLAELIPGHYSGVGAGTGAVAIIGWNVPMSKISGGGYQPFNDAIRNYIRFGTLTNDADNGPPVRVGNAILTTAQSYYIDQKMDDGIPLKGRVVMESHAVNCISSTDPEVAVYSLTYEGPACVPQFVLDQ